MLNFKNKSPEEKLRAGMRLSELVLNIARAGIQDQIGASDRSQIAAELRRRIALKEEMEKTWRKFRRGK